MLACVALTDSKSRRDMWRISTTCFSFFRTRVNLVIMCLNWGIFIIYFYYRVITRLNASLKWYIFKAAIARLPPNSTHSHSCVITLLQSAILRKCVIEWLNFGS